MCIRRCRCNVKENSRCSGRCLQKVTTEAHINSHQDAQTENIGIPIHKFTPTQNTHQSEAHMNASCGRTDTQAKEHIKTQLCRHTETVTHTGSYPHTGAHGHRHIQSHVMQTQ